MKLTSRIALGLALLTGLMLGVLAYQLRTVNELQLVNQDLSRTNVEAARISIRLVQDIEAVREFAEKALVWRSLGPDWQSPGPDEPGYEDLWETFERAVGEELERIRELELGPRERQALRDVEVAWIRYLYEIPPLRADEAPVPRGADLDPVLGRIHQLMNELRGSVEEVIDANQAEIVARAGASAAAGERARHVAWLSAIAAGSLAILICVFLYLSISGPLRRLTRGTREVAEGRFEHRIPVTGTSELSALARDFNHMASRLDELEDMKRDFVSHVSHELKGPLAAIHETILVLLERIPGPLTEKQAQLLALSRQSATRLSGMISNLLEVSRIEGGALFVEPDWVDIGPLVRDVRDELTPLATEKAVEIEVREGPGLGSGSIAADPDRLREVVGNLLENAVKFSPPGGRITIRTEERNPAPDSLPRRHRESMRRQSPPFLLLSIEDQGPGIPEEHREGVFEKFYQVKRGSRVQGQGVGLGLAICRSVIEAHGGVIWVEEGDQGGARFMALLPRVPPDAFEPARRPPSELDEESTGDDSPTTVAGFPHSSRAVRRARASQVPAGSTAERSADGDGEGP
jgi:signal transduction histidine kinase